MSPKHNNPCKLIHVVVTELQIRADIEDNSKIFFFLISQQKHML